MDNNTKGIGDNSNAYENRYEGMLEQAVRFLDKLCCYARLAGNDVEQAINGKNVVVRTNSAVSANGHLQELEKETAHWFEVLQTMKAGKDVHIEQNCKGSKLEIVAGSEYEFGQYLIDRSDGKFCEDDPLGDRGNRNGGDGNLTGKAFIEKVTND